MEQFKKQDLMRMTDSARFTIPLQRPRSNAFIEAARLQNCRVKKISRGAARLHTRSSSTVNPSSWGELLGLPSGIAASGPWQEDSRVSETSATMAIDRDRARVQSSEEWHPLGGQDKIIAARRIKGLSSLAPVETSQLQLPPLSGRSSSSAGGLAKRIPRLRVEADTASGMVSLKTDAQIDATVEAEDDPDFNMRLGANVGGRLRSLDESELQGLCGLERSDYIVSNIAVRERTLCINHLREQQISEHGVGGNLWGPALVFCRLLGSHLHPPGPYLSGKHVIELGSGTGTVGLAAAALGATVTLSDIQKVLPLTARNMKDNTTLAPGICLTLLDWLEVSRWPRGSLPQYDLVICSDVLYWSDVVPDLALVMGSLLSTMKTTLIWVWVKRHERVARELWRAFAAQGIVMAKLPLDNALLASIDDCHVSNHIEAYVGCMRGGRLDSAVLNYPVTGFLLDSQGCVKGVKSSACPHY